MQIEKNKVPGSDGFVAEFSHVCWEFLKNYLMVMFSSFHVGEGAALLQLSFGTIVLFSQGRECGRNSVM
jgi:hypothetical protein